MMHFQWSKKEIKWKKAQFLSLCIRIFFKVKTLNKTETFEVNKFIFHYTFKTTLKNKWCIRIYRDQDEFSMQNKEDKIEKKNSLVFIFLCINKIICPFKVKVLKIANFKEYWNFWSYNKWKRKIPEIWWEIGKLHFSSHIHAYVVKNKLCINIYRDRNAF